MSFRRLVRLRWRPEGAENQIKVNGVEVWVETFGNPADPPVLLIGVTTLSWPNELCAALTRRYVVRSDLRDAGQTDGTDRDPERRDVRLT